MQRQWSFYTRGYVPVQSVKPPPEQQRFPDMSTPWPKLLLIFVLLVTGRIGLSADNKHDLPRLERSFWLHASLAPTAQKGYWGPAYPASPSPTESDIQNAAKLLTSTYAANRLYLVYHAEIPVEDAVQVFGWWRRHCPDTVTLVPTLVLRMYDKQQTPVFTPEQLRRLVEFFQQSINADQRGGLRCVSAIGTRARR